MALTRKEIARRKALGAHRAEVAHLIKYEMKKRAGHDGRSLAKVLGCSGQIVSATILGKKHSPTVLDGLKGLGVPEWYLYDPREGV